MPENPRQQGGVDIAYKGELMLLQWGESSSRGRTVTFLLPEDEENHPFRTYAIRSGKRAGQRFMAVLVEVGADEQPVQQKPSQLAATICKDKEFWHWANEHSFDTIDNEEAARAFILTRCGIDSRSKLDKDHQARLVFEHNIMQPFNEYRRVAHDPMREAA